MTDGNCRICYAPKRGRCSNCKLNDYHRKKGRGIRACRTCGVRRWVAANGECRKCLRDAGLKACRACGSVKVALLDFKTKQGRCRACLRGLRR